MGTRSAAVLLAFAVCGVGSTVCAQSADPVTASAPPPADIRPAAGPTPPLRSVAMTSDQAAAAELPRQRPPPRDNGVADGGIIIFAVAYLPAVIWGIAGAPSGLPLVLPVVGPAIETGIVLTSNVWPQVAQVFGAIFVVDSIVQGLGVAMFAIGYGTGAHRRAVASAGGHGPSASLQWIVTPGAGASPLGLTLTAILF